MFGTRTSRARRMGNRRARAQSRAVTMALVCAALLAMTVIAFIVSFPR
jgi:hypothetical protein